MVRMELSSTNSSNYNVLKFFGNVFFLDFSLCDSFLNPKVKKLFCLVGLLGKVWLNPLDWLTLALGRDIEE